MTKKKHRAESDEEDDKSCLTKVACMHGKQRRGWKKEENSSNFSSVSHLYGFSLSSLPAG